MELKELKEKIIPIVEDWANKRIDALALVHPRMNTASFYMKKGISNFLHQKAEQLISYLDSISLFFCDSNGIFDENVIFNDMMKLFEEMDEVQFEYGFLRGTVGKGIVRIHIPDNPIASFLFGNNGAIKITKEDFIDLSSMLFGQKKNSMSINTMRPIRQAQ